MIKRFDVADALEKTTDVKYWLFTIADGSGVRGKRDILCYRRHCNLFKKILPAWSSYANWSSMVPSYMHFELLCGDIVKIDTPVIAVFDEDNWIGKNFNVKGNTDIVRSYMQNAMKANFRVSLAD